MSRLDQGMNRARGMLAGFTPGQRAVVVIGALGLILGGYTVTRLVATPNLSPMYSGLSGADASAVVEELQAQGVTYQLADGGTTVLVPQSQVYALRVSLAGQGLPANKGGENAGWSLLDDQGITATDFQQNVAFRRALEGELNKTLAAMDGVNTAVTHIAIPEKDVFSDEQEATTASVLLSVKPGSTVSNDQVAAMTNLVAGSVSGLAAEDVTITDQSGTLLSAPGTTGAGTAGAAGVTDEQTAAYEDRMSSAVQKVLDRVVGTGNAVVRVNAQLDFSRKETTSERYTQPTPTPPPLSQATVEEEYSGAGSAAGGTLGEVAPSPLAGAGGNGDYSRSQSTVNNAVDKTVERATSAPGAVQRLTVAVVLNARTAGALNTGQVQTLVANAVGLDPTRGDTVQVDALPFDETAAAAAAKELASADQEAKTAQYVDLGKKAGIGLLALVVLILALRGAKKGGPVEGTASDLPVDGVILPPGLAGAIGAGPGGISASAANALEAGRNPSQVRRDVTALVDNQPEEVARMLQSWLAERSR